MKCSALNVDFNGVMFDPLGHRLAAHHNKHCWRAFRGYQHRWPWTTSNPQTMGFKWFLCYLRLRRTLRVNFSLKYTWDRRRQSAYEIKLMLWRVSWALAQISCIDKQWWQTKWRSMSNVRLYVYINTMSSNDHILATYPASVDRHICCALTDNIYIYSTYTHGDII